MTKNATLSYDGKSYELPVVTGTEAESAVDIAQLRAKSGLITLDSGYANTGACTSNITFIDGEQGILRYRGYPVEELAQRSSFVETAYLLIFGELPTVTQLADFRRMLGEHEFIHEDMLHHFDGFPANAPPMAILSAMINALGCFQPQFMQPEDNDHFMEPAARLMSKRRPAIASRSAGRSTTRGPNCATRPTCCT
jgi:citrate synthase